MIPSRLASAMSLSVLSVFPTAEQVKLAALNAGILFGLTFLGSLATLGFVGIIGDPRAVPAAMFGAAIPAGMAFLGKLQRIIGEDATLAAKAPDPPAAP